MADINLPQSKDLFELYLEENEFTGIDLTAYPALQYLSLSGNKLESFDASLYPRLNMLSLADNKLSAVKLDNKNLQYLDLGDNMLEEVDLAGVPALEQLSLYGNRLSHIDVSPLTRLRVLALDHNKFKFSTLPPNKNYTSYSYAEQDVLPAEVVNGVVDLSSEAEVNGTATVYRWFVGVPSYDDYGELVGDELEAGTDFVIENGITRFAKLFTNVMCVLTNDEFPRMLMYTPFLDVETTGIARSAVGAGQASVALSGRDIVVRAAAGAAVKAYDASGREVYSGVAASGSCALSGLPAGIYVVKVGGESFKVALR